MNRGSDEEVPVLVHVLVASMRPRFMNRGSGAVLVVPLGVVPGFNEAPIHESGKFA